MRTIWIFAVTTILVLFGETGNSRALLQSAMTQKEYNINNIPLALLKDADAVTRINSVRFEVKDQKRSRLLIKRAVTIFKKEEQHYGKLKLWYDKFKEIEDLDGTIYDAHGEKIRSLSGDDIKDYCDYTNYSLYSDTRIRSAELYYDQYPYTIEYIYEYSYKGYLNWPTWYSQISLDPIELSRFEVLLPVEDILRYWCNRDTIKPSITMDGGKKIYIWEFKNLPKQSKDIVGEDIEDVATIVRIAPSIFEYGDYRGNMRTWNEFGKWDYSLLEGRDKLPESAIKEIHSLIKPTDEPREKIKKLYRYMQDRTRYVSVDLGIGGWQPFDATYVHERGYGDCKALSNYMVALLKEVGITGYSVDILPGSHRYPFLQKFPNAHFTHVIACVPLMPDTIWLECTSQTTPFGHIDAGLENRNALLLSQEGGFVVRTPPTTPQQNRQQRQGTVTFAFLGNAEAMVTILRTGDQQDYIREALDDASPEEREQWVMNHLGVPNANLKSYKFEGLDTHDLKIDLSFQIALPRFASYSGDRMFFQPNLMERRTTIPPDVVQRLSPIRYDYPYLDIDSISYSLPSGFTAESLPGEVHLMSTFGEFNSKTIAFGDSVIVYQRSLEIKDYSIPAKNYNEYRRFFADIVKADRAQVVLIRKDRK